MTSTKRAMKATACCARAVLALAAASLLILTLPAALADEETELMNVLKSDASLPAKADACKRLRIVGTARSVPALAALLDEDRLSQAARYALEGLPYPEAVTALRSALDQTSGRLQVGVIDSVGWRQDAGAVPHLIPFLTHPDPELATAAASALARIGGNEAVTALKTARDQVAPGVRPAVLDGLLTEADRSLTEGRTSAAIEIYKGLFASTEDERYRIAGYAGLIRATGDSALGMVTAALRGKDPAARKAALRAAGDLPDPEATATFAGWLATSSPEMQVDLLAILRERNDPVALPSVLALALGADDRVLPAALTTLGTLGDASAVPVLLAAATSDSPEAQAAAREALTLLHRGDITTALLTRASQASPAVQREIFTALSGRADPGVVPVLLALARTAPPATRTRALQAVGRLADARHLDALVHSLAESSDDGMRDEVRGVFETLMERFRDPGDLPVEPIVRGLKEGDRETRIALLPVGALFTDAGIREALRAAVRDSQPEIRNAAERALCTTRDVALLPDVLSLARQAQETALRTRALDGVVRLAAEEGETTLTHPQRAEALATAYAAAARPEERRMVLSGLGQVPDRVSLEVATRACLDPEVRTEAEIACLQIARGLGASDPDAAESSLKALAAKATQSTVQADARALLKSLNSGWLYAGPYREAGKQAQDLFEVAFPPESSTPTPLTWRRAPGSLDLTRPGEVDLGSVVGGDHCAIYLKTRVESPEARAVTFAIGSDDGVKLWVNGTLVHANNAVRGLTPDQDRATGRLLKGWNDLFVKLTQHTAGCGLTLRVLDLGGRPIPGLKWDPRGEPAP